VVAVDGTKIAAAATHHATRSYEQIAREILEQAAELDAAEDELHGDARGDELPVELRVAGDRRKRLREAKQALDAEREADAAPVARDRGERLRECCRRLEQEHELEQRLIAEHDAWLEAGIASDGSRRMTGARHNRKPYHLVELAERTINVTDPDARNLKTPRGWVQGYNAQAVVTSEQIIVAAEISTESLDTANLHPMPIAAGEELHAAGINDALDIVLADAGYWKNTAIEALAEHGLQPLIAPDADRRKPPRPGRRGGLYDFMRRVLATEHGSALYRQRQAIVEPVRTDQSQPWREPLPASRPLSRQIRMAPRRHAQPPETPSPPPRERLTSVDEAPLRRLDRRESISDPGTIPRHTTAPPARPVSATPSMETNTNNGGERLVSAPRRSRTGRG